MKLRGPEILMMFVIECAILYYRESSAIDIVQLHHLMFPKTTSSVEYTKMNITGLPMVKVRIKIFMAKPHNNFL